MLFWNHSKKGVRPIRRRATREDAFARMREKGLRITAQRKAVLTYLLSTEEHPSAQHVYQHVRKALPRIALSTVYGILADLSKNNIIRTLEFNEMENRYEAHMTQHINLVCLRCGKIRDFRTAYTLDVEVIKEETAFRTLQSRFELYGICQACDTATQKES